MSEKFRSTREKYEVPVPGAKDREVSGLLVTELNLQFGCEHIFSSLYRNIKLWTIINLKWKLLEMESSLNWNFGVMNKLQSSD